MRNYLDDKVAKKNNDREQKKNDPDFNNSDDGEVTYMYDLKKPAAFINEGEHGVFDLRKQTGINTAKSVFDKGSVFKTN
ncbi:hypothetical protein [Butyrivibrio sp. AE2032]|jgi:hypothetical protein|uniref:hypothetical protein n=1 Tax=Butyrivibrio sp. AE2032 TaxID=1458463 RepID=UPI00054F2A07|nr:hypothetical protein [Butyrivibrio sp. AE2032]